MKNTSIAINYSRHKLLSFLFVFASILTGCTQRAADQPVEEGTIGFEPVAALEQMDLPINMNIAGDTLYISVFHGDSLLNLYDESTGKYIRSTILRGNGPGEMLPPIQPMFDGNEVYVYSRPIMALFHSDVEHIDKLQKICTGPTMLSRIFAIGDGRFVGSLSAFGIDDKIRLDRYAMLDDSLKVMYTFGKYPSDGPNERTDNADALSHFHQTQNILRYNDSTLIAVGRRDISFYDLDDKGRYNCRDIVTVCPYDYIVEPATQNTSARTQLKDGYPRDICDAALYDGKIILAIYAGMAPSSSDTVYFEIRDGRTGKLIKRLTSDVEVTRPIAVNNKGEIVALRNLEDGMMIMRSKPITQL